MIKDVVKKIVKDKYREIATSTSACGCGCSCSSANSISKNIGYSEEELRLVGEANLGLGCGNPLSFGNIKAGDIVLDLGAGAGIDALLAAQKVGPQGKVIGIDMTAEMVERARNNAQKQKITNVEFLLGEIENLPLPDNFVDTIITNCVINLSPDKDKAFSEAYRVLKPGGKIYLSDIVLLAELSESQRNDENLLSGCVAGALLKEEYLDKIKRAGFQVRILHENTKISKEQYNGIALESLMVELVKKPTIGLFGTCGNSQWREPFITKYKQLGIQFFNPQVKDWKPELAAVEAQHLANDKIILFPITNETYATVALSEVGFLVLNAIKPDDRKSFVVMIQEDLNPELNDPIAREESLRARVLVLEHLRHLRLSNLYIVDTLEEMLDISLKLYQDVEITASLEKFNPHH